jgi:competence protein ComEC
MLSLRAPLFSVSLALATGCLVGIENWISLPVALVLFVCAGILWWLLSRQEGASLAAFSPDDLRRLPDDKYFPTTQWRGIVVVEPAAQQSVHTGHRALDRTNFVLRLEAWRATGGRYFNAPLTTPWQPAQGDVQCTLVGPTNDLRCGDELETATALEEIAPPLSPGQLDYRVFEAEQGIYYTATIGRSDWRRIGTGGGDFWANLSYRLRDWAYARLQIGLEDDPRIADFLAGMLIGYREEIPADIEQDFRRTGTLHVFAVSGQNIAELLVVVIVLLQLCGFVRWRWAWTLAPIVLLYCLLTGSPASAVRATVMAMGVLLAWKLSRPLNALGCWSLALIAMLLWNPIILLDPGAQLSFGVVLGLILLGPPIMRWIERPFAPDPFLPYDLLTRGQKREASFWHYTAALLGATIAATLVSEPITAVDFHQVTPISVLANLMVVPAAGLITVVGTLGVTFSLFTTTWAAWLNNSNWLFARLLIALVAFLARQPGASFNVPDIRTLNSPLPSFVVAPVQDSACLLLRTPGQTWLFNTGRETPARGATTHLLQFYGVNRLDGLVLLQMGVADIGGAPIIARNFSPRRIVVPAVRSQSPVEKALPGGPFEPWHENQNVALAPGVTVDVLNPSARFPANHEQDRSLVLLFHSAGGTLLWAGKIDAALQRELLAAHPDLHADVLVLDPDTNPSNDWLRALRVRAWLQIPRRDRGANVSTPTAEIPPCPIWPLTQTGSVDIHFFPAIAGQPAGMSLSPWVALPNVARVSSGPPGE